jgi:hypothetical protein
LDNTQPYHLPVWAKFLKLAGAIFLLLALLSPETYAQNTKGDRPDRSVSTRSRETKFKGGPKRKAKQKKSYNRVHAKESSQANRASTPAKIYSQKNQFVNNKSSTARIQKQNFKESSRRVPARSASSQTRHVYPQQGPYVNNPSKVPNDKPRFSKSYSSGHRRVTTPPKDGQQKWNAVQAQRVTVRSATGRTKNTFSQKGPYVHNPSRKPKPAQRIVSNQSQVARLQGSPSVKPPSTMGKRVKGRSASRPYISNKSINAFAGFWNKKPKGEKPYVKGDLAGKPLRKKNFETRFPKLVNPTSNIVKAKKPRDDKAYKGKAAGRFSSATREQGKRAWTGDIAGRRVRGGKDKGIKQSPVGIPVFPPKRSKPKLGDTPYKGTIPGGGYRSATKTHEGKISGRLTGKPPGRGVIGASTYSGTTRVRKGFGEQGANYSGTFKAKRAAKGGGSVSRSGWNNEGQPLVGTPPLRRNIGYALFAGNKRTRVAAKGGGSVSGKLWNNREAPLTGKAPSGRAMAVGSYQGNIKFTKTTPGKEIGGVPKKTRSTSPVMRDQGEEFAGVFRVRKKEPSKQVGGIAKSQLVKKPEKPGKEIAGFPGKFKDTSPVFRDQGEEFTGFIKLPRSQYVKNPYAATKDALKRSKPDKTADRYNILVTKVKQKAYGEKPHAAEGALKGIVASKSSMKASEYYKALRLKYDYVANPSSSKEALKTREPGKAFPKATDYQGNIKMKKFELFAKKGLHPDAKFVKTNKNNVDEERSMLTNFKLFWAKLFGKEDTQPAHLKDKYRRPRYDKGEGDIWYNKHNQTPGRSNSLRNAKTPEE